MKKKQVKKRKEFLIKQSLLTKILVILLILFMVLIITYIFVYEPKVKGGGIGGELGTSCVFCEDNVVNLSVLSATLLNDNATIRVNINWSGGNISWVDFDGIFLDFYMKAGANCNASILSIVPEGLPSFGENITYNIDSLDLVCHESDFTNVTGVTANADVDIHLMQLSTVSNIYHYTDDSKDNIYNLDRHFYALVDINYSIIESPANAQIDVFVNNYTKNISISVLGVGWFGTQTFNLTATTGEGDDLNTSNSGADMTFNILVVDDVRPVPNYDPEFDIDECEDFSWYLNTNLTVDFDDCWDDEDGDDLTYEYGDLHYYEDNISIIELSGNRIKFVPDIGFNGSDYLYFYANDSQVRVGQRVEIYILKNTSSSDYDPGYDPDPDPSSDDLNIISSIPSSSVLNYHVNDNKNFAITAQNYETIEWYVNQNLVKQGSLSYLFNETRPGSYLIEARIVNGTLIRSKNWDVTIEEDEYFEDKIFDVDMGEVIFYSIVVVLVIIILLVVWLFVVEKNKRKKKVNLGFGVSVVPNKNGSNSSSRQFNIPRG